jgi:ribosomal protein S12 methylthiotransferase accessory factor
LYRFGTYRRVAPRNTLAAILPIAKSFGVTRLADITGLDRIGIPVFQAVRPMAKSISVSQGKGVTRNAARVSALMEAIELHCAEIVAPDGSYVAPDREGEGPTDPGAWCAGTELLSGRPAQVPHAQVSMDYTNCISNSSSNGLASGNDRTEAIVAALCEVLERDAHAHWLARPASVRQRTAIDPDTITSAIGLRLLRSIRAAELGVRVWSFGDDHGVAAIACAVYELSSDSSLILPPTMGAGAHLEPAIALVRAVTEAVQIRATLIAGARDDLTVRDYGAPELLRLRFLTESVGPARPSMPWASLRSCSSGCLARDRERLFEAAVRAGARRIDCVDLSDPNLPVAVVKLLVPGFLGHAESRV